MIINMYAQLCALIYVHNRVKHSTDNVVWDVRNLRGAQPSTATGFPHDWVFVIRQSPKGIDLWQVNPQKEGFSQGFRWDKVW